MRVAANSRIMHKLATTGKLLGTSIISDYSSYKVKLTELLKSSGRVCSKNTVFAGEATLNFFILAFSSNAELWVLPNQHRKKFLAENISQQKAPTIYRQFNPPTGCQWPNFRFQCLRIVPNCIQPHPQRAHANSPRDIR